MKQITWSSPHSTGGKYTRHECLATWFKKGRWHNTLQYLPYSLSGIPVIWMLDLWLVHYIFLLFSTIFHLFAFLLCSWRDFIAFIFQPIIFFQFCYNVFNFQVFPPYPHILLSYSYFLDAVSFLLSLNIYWVFKIFILFRYLTYWHITLY